MNNLKDITTNLDVFAAYKKVKHYFYYDSTSMFVRDKIALFEASLGSDDVNFEDVLLQKFQNIADRINNLSLKDWEDYFKDNIACRITPKSFKKQNTKILTNTTNHKQIQLDRINIFIDVDVDIQIISVLWLMNVGHKLSKKIGSENYAYTLELKDDDNYEIDSKSIKNQLRLYKPYFIQYQNWRDDAIKKAEQLLDEKKDVVILSLDIKEYFHSVRIDLKKIENELIEEDHTYDNPNVHKLFNLLHLINSVYTDKIKEFKNIPNLKKGETILPIGLLSSGVLGNLYLSDFDEKIKDILNPAYYGRYVDDLLFVFSGTKVDNSALSPINNYLKKYFSDRDILTLQDESSTLLNFQKKMFPGKKDVDIKLFDPNFDVSQFNETDHIISNAIMEELTFHVSNNQELKIQSKKVILQYFDHKESHAIIDKFKKNLDLNRSEFRFLPDEDKVESEFDEEAFSMHYNDSVNKLRSIKDFSEDKYGASKYLAKKIFASNYSDERPGKKANKQILTFFNGVIGLSFHSLWEKVATYFIINEQSTELLKFYKQILRDIEIMEFNGTSEVSESKFVLQKTKTDLIKFLEISISTPLALYPKFNEAKLQSHMQNYQEILDNSILIRKSNMFRHSLVGVPSINFTKIIEDVSSNLIKTPKLNIDYEINLKLKLLAPRYVHFHELNILQIHKTVQNIKKGTVEEIININEIPNKAFSDYWHLNFYWKSLDEKQDIENIIKRKQSKYFKADIEKRVQTEENANRSIEIERQFSVEVFSENEKHKINKCIALANIKVDKTNTLKSILGKPNTSRERRQELFKVINMVEGEDCDLFVLPEVSVPYKWLNLLAHQSHKRDIGIVAGLEHWINGHNFAFNFIATILPIRMDSYTTCIIKIRLKNHYSHEEKELLKGYRLLLPDQIEGAVHTYDLFHWRRCYFSVYNCFELADINDRALFKSQVDFIIASEYNMDTAYFSDIGTSWVRDIHCYFIQVNSSDYGDSRIIQPSKSIYRDILQIKGGKNSSILVEEINIKALRDFQLMEYNLQKSLINSGLSHFKPTPPIFDRKNVLKRINNK